MTKIAIVANIVLEWKTGVLVADGAMGTLLFARGTAITSCVELLNVTTPEVRGARASRLC